jgi:hypothetical protein
VISNNILTIKERIGTVCAKINKDPNSIVIVAVTKGRGAIRVKEAIQFGLTNIGENRVQEALAKYTLLRTPNSELRTVKWHMVGHLQTNKVKDAVRIFDLIQSVDNLRLASEIDKQAAKINKVQDILIEVKTSPEAAKFGVKPDEGLEVIRKIAELKNLRIKGLMTIAPIVGSPEETRPYFRKLREIKNSINELRATNHELTILSMGMTDDFEVAIEEGSNMVRLGRAIFEG